MITLFSRASGLRGVLGRRRAISLVAVAVLVVASLFARLPKSDARPAAQDAPVACITTDEAGLLAAINDFRAQNDRQPLVFSLELDEAAQHHAQSMADFDYFDYTLQPEAIAFDQNIANFGYPSDYVGENIAAGAASADFAQVLAQWESVTSQRTNLLNHRFSAIGLGFAENPASALKTYWTATMGDLPTIAPPPCATPATETPTASPTPTATATDLPTSTPTDTATSTATETETPSATDTVTAAAESTEESTEAPTKQAVATETEVPTGTAVPTETESPTDTATATETSAPTETPTVEPTETQTATATETETTVPTATVQPTDTETAVPTDTETSVPTETETAIPTDTETPVPTETETPVPTDTETPVPTDTETPVPTDTATVMPTDTTTVAPTETETAVPTDTETAAPTDTPLPTDTPVPTDTATAEPSDTSVATETPVPSEQATESPQTETPATSGSPGASPVPISDVLCASSREGAKAGQNVTVVCGGYDPGESVQLYWGEVHEVNLVGEEVAGPDGVASFQVIAEELPAATYTLSGVGKTSQHISTASLQIRPGLFIVPRSGEVGDVISADLTGFQPNEKVAIGWFDTNAAARQLRAVTVGEDGSTTTTFRAPASTAGDHTIEATGSSGGKASATFTLEIT